MREYPVFFIVKYSHTKKHCMIDEIKIYCNQMQRQAYYRKETTNI